MYDNNDGNDGNGGDSVSNSNGNYDAASANGNNVNDNNGGDSRTPIGWRQFDDNNRTTTMYVDNDGDDNKGRDSNGDGDGGGDGNGARISFMDISMVVTYYLSS